MSSHTHNQFVQEVPKWFRVLMKFSSQTDAIKYDTEMDFDVQVL